MDTQGASTFRSGYAAILGEPNVGKSTLLNSILDEKLSIVATKPQTTRQRVLGILNRPDAQIVFLDTPGIINPRYLLHKKMMQHAESAASDADVLIVLTEVARRGKLPDEVEALMRAQHSKPALLVINKIDTIHRLEVLPLMAAFAQRGTFKEIIPISALKKENTDDLITTIARYLPAHPAFYPDDIISEQPEKFFVAEFIREKVFQVFHDEIPYSTAVEIVEFKEQEAEKTVIRADIIVERDSQKGILIGKGGDALKRVGQAARKDIEAFIQRDVFLDLRVKVREHWRENEGILRRLGYSEE